MILGFSTQINGKETFFVEKIWTSLYERYKENEKYFMPDLYYNCLDKGFKNMNPFCPKIHTIREDKNDRWKAGLIIDFFINVRTKDMFRFAPRVPVVSIQKIDIGNPYPNNPNYMPNVWINDKKLNSIEVQELAKNDGFDTIDEFFAYFNTDFTGKIIHWTDKKY